MFNLKASLLNSFEKHSQKREKTPQNKKVTFVFYIERERERDVLLERFEQQREDDDDDDERWWWWWWSLVSRFSRELS